MHCVSPGVDIAHYQTKNKFGPQSKNLSSIIRGFKIGVTKNVHIINKDFEWQNIFATTLFETIKGIKVSSII